MDRAISFKGNPLTIHGEALRTGELLPKFKIVGTDMQDLTNEKFQGKVLVVAAVPSIDTPVCQTETRRFNEEASKLSSDVVVLTVSMDLPFAQKRFCAAEGIERVVLGSDYKYRNFGEAFGVYAEELGLLARATFVADRAGKIQYVDYLADIASEPDYNAVLEKVRSLV